MLFLRTFGGLALESDGKPGTGAAGQRARLAILAFIATAGDSGVSRDRITALFWPESDTERAHGSLKQALYSLRRDSREQDLTLGTTTLRLNPEVVVSDVGEFQSAIAEKKFDIAVAKYSGVFLDGIHLPGNVEFERWLDRERERLSHDYASSLETLAEAAAAKGKHKDAAQWWRRLAATDMMNARTARAYISALADSADFDGAIKHGQLYDRLVRSELGIEPDPSIAVLIDQLRSRPREWTRAAIPLSDASIPVVALPHPSRRDVYRRWIPATVVAALTVLAGFGALKYRSKPPTEPMLLAVLPFENRGPAEEDFFVDGLSDAISGKLAGITGLVVIDRRNTAEYKKTTKPIRQIGLELGAQFVLGGVVRGKKNASGNWRALVMPTLVNTNDGTTKWAGDPVIVSYNDPFTAQTEIATKVAKALRLAVDAEDRRELTKRFTQNPEAYNAYLRGRAMMEGWGRSPGSVRAVDETIAQFNKAVSADPKFARAWALLANAHWVRTALVPGDTASLNAGAREARRADALDPDDPVVIANRAGHAYFAGDRDLARRILGKAAQAATIEPDIMVAYAVDLWRSDQHDSANAVIDRVVTANPRLASVVDAAASMAARNKDWYRVRKHARTLIALDPADERGWMWLTNVGFFLGDTAEVHDVLSEAFHFIPAPSNLLLGNMMHAGSDMALRYAQMTPAQLKIETLADSIDLYDSKAAVFVNRRDLAKARVYYDSIIAKLEKRDFSGLPGPVLNMYLAYAYSSVNRQGDALRELHLAETKAKKLGLVRPDGSPRLGRGIWAGVLANTGQYHAAVWQLRQLIAEGQWTRAGVAPLARFRALRGNAEFEAFLREPDAKN